MATIPPTSGNSVAGAMRLDMEKTAVESKIKDVPATNLPRFESAQISREPSRSGNSLPVYIPKADSFGAESRRIMHLFVESLSEQRDIWRDARNQERKLMVSESNLAIDNMRDAAWFDFGAAMATNAASIAGGAVGIGGSIKVTTGLASGKMTQAGAQAANNKYMGIGQLTNGIGGTVGSSLTVASTSTFKTEQARLETQSGLHRSLSEDQSDYYKRSVETVKEGQQMIKELNNNVHEANSAILDASRI